MIKLRPAFFLFTLFLILIYSLSTYAQQIPDDLSNINVDNLSDGQIRQLIQQANASNLSDAQLVQIAERKGLPATEAVKLTARIRSLKNGQEQNTDSKNNLTETADSIPSKRKLSFIPEPDSASRIKPDLFDKIFPKVFGSDLFKNSNLTFAPNLKLATPKNYIIGPDDQLNINVYGNSLANWKLDVSPEGNINIPGIGLLNVAGKSIEQATANIKSKLAAGNYAVGRGTTVQVSLGNIRSIKVILVGQINKPGTYTLPSLATAFNALYSAGGPNNNGSFRQIEIIRNNKLIRTLDIYDFLLKGDQINNIGLQDQDIIRVPTYRTHVELAGEIKTPAIFEVLPGETLQNVLGFAGGFSDVAYTNRVKVLQISDQQRKITDVYEADYKNYIPLRGDKYIVDRILDRYENQVSISGAVFRPGMYELEKGLTLSRLIEKAAGLKEDAFTGRGSITRLKQDNSKELISFDIKAILNKSAADIPLQREDSVAITSLFDLRDKYNVTIKGEVRKPGAFPFAEGMKVADLIVQSGGFTEGASAKRIEVAQRKTDSDPKSLNSDVAIVFSVDLDNKLDLNNADFTLHPYDIVSVYSLPGYEKQRTVKIEGEVLYPGYYTLKTKNEKISDILKRAGSLTASADADGSSLKRTNIAILGVDKNKRDSSAIQERSDRLRRIQSSFKDSADVQTRNNYIGIDLKKILEKPGSITDLILEDGDVIRVPKQQQIVRVNGEVLFPSAVVFEKSKSFNDYVINAGGFAPTALKRGAYVVYANGTVRGTRKFLFFTSRPAIKPGSEIYVPKKLPPRANTTQEILGITSGLASVAAIIFGIISLRR
ncbi:SLBB domain-containing protein [Mucilaginibacter gynuensis]|uniref:SLBB domain-containing protein n=1 Tax=Mucilaginibacter gynuensis TaxID=1302236 RepID=A0ABP8GMX6_9SPHI